MRSTTTVTSTAIYKDNQQRPISSNSNGQHTNVMMNESGQMMMNRSGNLQTGHFNHNNLMNTSASADQLLRNGAAGGAQSYVNVQRSQTRSVHKQQPQIQFIHPEQMLRSLIPYADNENANVNSTSQQQHNSNGQTVLMIQRLQQQSDNIHAEIIEAEHMLNTRDTLYGQLDMLRDERGHIQDDIAHYQSVTSSNKEVVITGQQRGYKEMNERLRRRISEVAEYIHKMELQNKKIESTLDVGGGRRWSREKERGGRSRTQPSGWVDNAYFHQQYEGGRSRDASHVNQLIQRIHQKQEEAMDRVRRQEQDIDRRNQLNRTMGGLSQGLSQGLVQGQAGSFYPDLSQGIKGGSALKTSAGLSRSFYGSGISRPIGGSIGGRRYHSPQYRY